MKRRTDRERDRAPRSVSAGDRDRSLDGLAVATHDDLAWSIVVCHCAYLVRAGGFGSNRLPFLNAETEQRRHRAIADRNGLLHRAAAQPEQTRRIADGYGTRRRGPRVFTERMPRHENGIAGEGKAALYFKNMNDRKARRHQRRLRVFGEGE